MKTTPLKNASKVNTTVNDAARKTKKPVAGKQENKENPIKQDRPYIPDEEFGGAGFRRSREGHPGQTGPQQGIEHRPLLEDGV